MTEVEVLVTNYNTIKRVLGPLHTAYTILRDIVSWTNPNLSFICLVVSTLLLFYPGYLQILVLGGCCVLFGVGYLDANSPDPIPPVSPTSFINPVYYSLVPEANITARSRVIRDYKEMLGELDQVFGLFLEWWDVLGGVVTWWSRDLVIMVCWVVIGPSVVPLNVVLLVPLWCVMCYNTWLGQLVAPRDVTSPPRDVTSSPRDVTEEAGRTSDDSTESEPDLATCWGCKVVCAGLNSCTFCGQVLCGACCDNVVTKAQLGVTNPETKHHRIVVCSDCFVSIPTATE